MNQKQLFKPDVDLKTPPPVETMHRPSHPDTSREAAEVVRLKWSSRVLLAYQTLKRKPGSTARELDELADANGKIWKRMADLERLKLAKRNGKRKCEITGNNAVVWEPITREIFVEGMPD